MVGCGCSNLESISKEEKKRNLKKSEEIGERAKIRYEGCIDPYPQRKSRSIFYYFFHKYPSLE